MINQTSKVLSELNICLYDNSGSMKKATDLIYEIRRAFENLTEDQKSSIPIKFLGLVKSIIITIPQINTDQKV